MTNLAQPFKHNDMKSKPFCGQNNVNLSDKLPIRLATDGRMIVEEVEGQSFWAGQNYIARCVESELCRYHAEEIVRRWNAHNELIAALRQIAADEPNGDKFALIHIANGALASAGVADDRAELIAACKRVCAAVADCLSITGDGPVDVLYYKSKLLAIDAAASECSAVLARYERGQP